MFTRVPFFAAGLRHPVDSSAPSRPAKSARIAVTALFSLLLAALAFSAPAAASDCALLNGASRTAFAGTADVTSPQSLFVLAAGDTVTWSARPAGRLDTAHSGPLDQSNVHWYNTQPAIITAGDSGHQFGAQAGILGGTGSATVTFYCAASGAVPTVTSISPRAVPRRARPASPSPERTSSASRR
jgi:hypothetical protein